MDQRYMCYCGLYCGNCAVKAKVEPASKVLHDEMKRAGFEDIIHLMPQGEAFWDFLTSMAENGTCVSCKEGSGYPGCPIRKCAQEKNIEVCALCPSYPCQNFDDIWDSYPGVGEDNVLLRDQGLDAWSKLQDERLARGFTYSDEKTTEGV